MRGGLKGVRRLGWLIMLQATVVADVQAASGETVFFQNGSMRVSGHVMNEVNVLGVPGYNVPSRRIVYVEFVVSRITKKAPAGETSRGIVSIDCATQETVGVNGTLPDVEKGSLRVAIAEAACR